MYAGQEFDRKRKVNGVVKDVEFRWNGKIYLCRLKDSSHTQFTGWGKTMDLAVKEMEKNTKGD